MPSFIPYTVNLITFVSQVIWQYKMDLFPVAVLGLPQLFRVAELGGSEYKFWSFCKPYIARLSALMSIGRLRNMAPHWLDEAVKYISKPIEGEGRNLLKKGWDQLYMDPITKEGFLEEAKKAQKDAAEKREKDKQASLFQAMKDWEAKHGDISQFDASKVDVMSIHEQAALNVSSAESKYHKM